jgi:hypothetical protein
MLLGPGLVCAVVDGVKGQLLQQHIVQDTRWQSAQLRLGLIANNMAWVLQVAAA